MSGEDKIALVNDKNEIIGYEKKSIVHINGLLHKAFSILIFNSKKELLIQKRASTKYHSGGLWTNTCCSHLKKSEDLEEAARNRLQEEMGINVQLKEVFAFRYNIKFENGLIENEIDHVFIGYADDDPVLNLEEAESYKWISLEELYKDVLNNPLAYSYWFKIILEKIKGGDYDKAIYNN